MPQVDRDRVRSLTATETARFLKHHRKSKRLIERVKRSLIAGVPMNWMVRWAGP